MIDPQTGLPRRRGRPKKIQQGATTLALHPSVPKGLFDRDTSVERCSAIYKEYFGYDLELPEVRSLISFEGDPLYLESEENQPPIVQAEPDQGRHAREQAQDLLEKAFIERFLRGLSKKGMLKELNARGVSLSAWNKRKLTPTEAINYWWEPTSAPRNEWGNNDNE